MKKKFTFFKTLLVAAGLLGGSNAWADWTTVYSNDYTNASTYDAGWTNGNTGRIAWGQWTRPDLNESVTDRTAMRLYMLNSNNGSNATFNGLSSVTAYTSSSKYKIEFDFGLSRGSNQNPSFVLYALDNSTVLVTFQGETSTGKKTFTTNAGNTGYFYSASEQYNSFNLTDAAPAVFNHVIIEADATNGTTITVSSPGTNDDNKVEEHTVVVSTDMKYFGKMVYNTGRYNSHLAIDNLTVSIYSDTEIVPNPSAAITGVNGTDRTLTMTLGTGSSDGTVIKYYTDTEEKSDLATYSAPFTVSSTSTIYYYAESTSGATSDEQNISVTCEALTLNTPTISRSGNNVTISDDQSNLDASPSATIYYSYNGSDYAEYTEAITVSADAIVYAYAAANGYTNSETATRAVALFPSTGITQIENATYTSYSSSTLTDEAVTVSEREYAALKLDGTRWGTKILLQTTGWGLRGDNTWYVNGTSYIYLPDMKAGDIVVANVDKKADYLVNATFSEKYTHDTNYAYIVSADGGVELGFTRVSSKTNNYVRGFYAYSYDVTATITDAGFATLYTNKALDFSDVSGLTAYTATVSDNTVTLTAVDDVPANTGVVLKGDADTYSIPVIASSSTGQGDLAGSAAEATAYNAVDGKTLYILTKDGDEAQFNPVTSGEIAAGKAYLPVTTGSGAKLRVVFADDATAIKTIAVDAAENAAIYNLSGQRVNAAYKGIVIKNGKKYLNK